MATIVQRTIGSDPSDDYANISLWAAAIPSDLTAVDQIWRGVVRDEEIVESGTVSVSGVTSDSTRYVHLTAGTDYGGAGFEWFGEYKDAADFKLSYGVGGPRGARVLIQNVGSGSYKIIFNIYYSLFERLQLTDDTTSSTYALFVLFGTVTARQFIVKDTRNKDRTVEANGGPCTLENALIIRHVKGTSFGSGCIWNTGSSGSVGIFRYLTCVRPSTFSSGDKGYKSSKYMGHAEFENWCSFNLDTNVSDPYGKVTVYNNGATSAADQPSVATASYTGLTFADQVVNTADDFRAKAGSTLEGNGKVISGITTDIVGNTRSATAPTIGCFEVVSSSGTVYEESMSAGVSTSLGEDPLTLFNPQANVALQAGVGVGVAAVFASAISVGVQGMMSEIGRAVLEELVTQAVTAAFTSEGRMSISQAFTIAAASNLAKSVEMHGEGALNIAVSAAKTVASDASFMAQLDTALLAGATSQAGAMLVEAITAAMSAQLTAEGEFAAVYEDTMLVALSATMVLEATLLWEEESSTSVSWVSSNVELDDWVPDTPLQ